MSDELANALLDADEQLERAHKAAIEQHMPDVADEVLRAKRVLVEAVRKMTRRPIPVRSMPS